MIVLLVMIQEFYCTNTCEYTNIPSCRGNLVFDSSGLQEGIFVYTLVKLYNRANLSHIPPVKIQMIIAILYEPSMFPHTKYGCRHMLGPSPPTELLCCVLEQDTLSAG